MSAIDTDEPVLVQEGWARRSRPLPRRRAVAEAALGGAFLASATALAVLADAARDFDVGQTVVLVAMFAVGIRVRIDVGTAYTAPVQLAFVPMLLLLPTPYVPLLVLLAWFLGRLGDMRGADPLHPSRLLIVPTDCWFAVGPALVLILADAQTPDWGHWPVYLLALAAQFGAEAVSSFARELLGERSTRQMVSRELALVWGIDALLSPLGLLAAFASTSFDYAFMLLIPPAALLGFYASERTQRITNALALAEAARDRQGMIAGASHELVTPLAVLVGLTDRLVSGGDAMSAQRRAQVDTTMRREVLALRHVVRQFVDYTRIKTERDLGLRPEPVDLFAVANEVAGALSSSGRLVVTGSPDTPPAQIDPDRAQQIITALASLALEGTEGARLEVGADAAMVTVASVTPTSLPERPFAEGGEGAAAGLGLYVARELARRQGGDLTAEATSDGGARYTLTLPRAV